MSILCISIADIIHGLLFLYVGRNVVGSVMIIEHMQSNRSCVYECISDAV